MCRSVSTPGVRSGNETKPRGFASLGTLETSNVLRENTITRIRRVTVYVFSAHQL